MVYGIHWLDDLIDSLDYHKLLFENGKKTRFDILQAGTKDVADMFRPYGVGRMLRSISGRHGIWLRLVHGSPRWRDGVEMGLMRVICGGLIQRSEGRIRKQAVKRVRKDVHDNMSDQQIQGMLSSQNTAFWWGLSKTAMPLVLGMFWEPADDPRLFQKSIMLDVTLMPLLVWHNLEEEIRRGEVKKAGFEGKGIGHEVASAVKGSVKIAEKYLSEIPRWNGVGVWDSMKPVLKATYDEMRQNLPKDHTYEEYCSMVDLVLDS